MLDIDLDHKTVLAIGAVALVALYLGQKSIAATQARVADLAADAQDGFASGWLNITSENNLANQAGGWIWENVLGIERPAVDIVYDILNPQPEQEPKIEPTIYDDMFVNH